MLIERRLFHGLISQLKPQTAAKPILMSQTHKTQPRNPRRALPGASALGGLHPVAIRSTIPDYLERYYWWAYLRPASLRIFDHPAVVSAILWGQYRRLSDAVLAEIAPGSRVLQLACVYGDLTPRLVDHLGPRGRLAVVDAAPIQVENLAAKLGADPRITLTVGDAATPGAGHYDAVVCFFLLHELPDDHKQRVVDAALDRLAPGGRAIFVDYARPRRWHPLRPLMALVFRLLEPFAAEMWRRPVRSFASVPGRAKWRERRLLGGLYQIVVAERAD